MRAYYYCMLNSKLIPYINIILHSLIHSLKKSILVSIISQLSKPWITQGLRKSIKIKNSLFYSGDIDMYKYYRNKISVLTRLSKKAYYHKYFEDNITNIKKNGTV